MMLLNRSFVLASVFFLSAGCSSTDDESPVGSGGMNNSGVGGTESVGSGSAGSGGANVSSSGGSSTSGSGGAGSGGAGAGGDTSFSAGGNGVGGDSNNGSGGAMVGNGGMSSADGGGPGSGGAGSGGSGSESTGEGVDQGVVSFFVTSWFQLDALAQEEGRGTDGFGGDLRYPTGEMDGLQGADNLCQEMADRAGFGDVFWKAYLSTSQINAIDHIDGGPWYDYNGDLVATDKAGLLSAGDSCGNFNGRLSASPCGTYDEVGTFHDGNTDVNDDTLPDDDHDTMTATKADGTYAGFSCSDWTSVTDVATGGGQGGPGGFGGGIQMGHSWPAMSGAHWAEAHAGHSCKAGTNFIQNGPGDAATVGGGGGYGGFYCFASN